MTLHIALVDETGTLSASDLSQLVDVATRYAREVARYWGVQASAHVYARGAPSYAWPITFLHNSDQADALAYHEIDDRGRPAGRVFVDTLRDAGASMTVGFTHELGEMLADPYCVLGAQVNDATFVAQEICDPVEADDLAWDIDGVKVSDFVTPAWFVPGLPGDISYNGGIDQPLTLAAGGYASLYRNGAWSQVFADRPDTSAMVSARRYYTDDGAPAPSLRAATAHRILRRTEMVDLAVALGHGLSGVA